MPLSAPPASWTTLQNKPTTVAGFGISDMGSQTVANAANVTNVTTTQVLNATASAALGAVGSYAFLYTANGAQVTVGATQPGSNLYYSNTTTSTAGTWRLMGGSGNANSLFFRIS